MTIKTMNVFELVERGLRVAGYDGLSGDDFDCACTLDELAPCGDVGSYNCVAGYRRDFVDGCDCANGSCDFHITPRRQTPDGLTALTRATAKAKDDDDNDHQDQD